MIIPNVFSVIPAQPEGKTMPEKTEKPDTLAAAMFAVQQELDGIVKDATNPHFRNKYVDRTTLLNTLRPLYGKYGLLMVQTPVPSPTLSISNFYTKYDEKGEITEEGGSPDYLALKTSIIHVESGEVNESTLVVPLPKPDPQGYGSALTYASRYALVAVHGIPLLDDDGEGAARPTRPAAGTSSAEKVSPAKDKKPKATATTETKPTPPASEASDTKQTTTVSTAAKEEKATTATGTTTAEAKTTAKPGRKLWGAK